MKQWRYKPTLLNGEPVYLRGALDQSFNPQGIYTAPSDEFLRRDMELAKSLGLNFLRIHIKPDEPRRLYWADKLGVLLMQDMPNTWEQSPRARQAWEATLQEVIERDRNHPAIIAWCLFNETWGLRSLAYRIAKNRKAHYVMLDVDAPPAAIAELERQSNINEDIIRFLTIRVNEHEKGPSAMMRRGDKDRERSRDRAERDDRPSFRAREEEVE